MKRPLSIFSLLFILLACSSQKRTPYQKYKHKKGGGYSESIYQDNLKLVSFRGNSRTKKSYAELFAKFRTIEICHEESKFSQMLSITDNSKAKTVTRSTSDVYGFPSYYGYHPYRYSGIGFSAGFNTIRSDSWDETLVYPQIDVVYRCLDVIKEPEVIFREVPPSEMNVLVKDLKGALQVEKILDESPNKNSLKVGDIILKAKGERVQKNDQVLSLFNQKVTSVPIEILREGTKKSLSLKASSVTPQIKTMQNTIVKTACDFEEIKKKRQLCTTH